MPKLFITCTAILGILLLCQSCYWPGWGVRKIQKALPEKKIQTVYNMDVERVRQDGTSVFSEMSFYAKSLGMHAAYMRKCKIGEPLEFNPLYTHFNQIQHYTGVPQQWFKDEYFYGMELANQTSCKDQYARCFCLELDKMLYGLDALTASLATGQIPPRSMIDPNLCMEYRQ